MPESAVQLYSTGYLYDATQNATLTFLLLLFVVSRGLARGLLGRLARLLVLLRPLRGGGRSRGLLQNERAQLVRHVHGLLGTARRALVLDEALPNDERRLREVAVRAEDELVNEHVEKLLKIGRLVRAVDSGLLGLQGVTMISF